MSKENKPEMNQKVADVKQDSIAQVAKKFDKSLAESRVLTLSGAKSISRKQRVTR